MFVSEHIPEIICQNCPKFSLCLSTGSAVFAGFTGVPNRETFVAVARISCYKAYMRHGLSAGLMPTEAFGNYLPEAPYLRETKTYLNCNSRMHGYIEPA